MHITAIDPSSPQKGYICSDGTLHQSPCAAAVHEREVRISKIFPPSVIEYSHTFGSKRYHLNKHMYIGCGIYHIVLRDADDMTAMNYFFKGVRNRLDCPDDDEYPIEFDLEIFYEDVPGVIMNYAQWRLYGDDIVRHGLQSDGKDGGNDG